VTNGAVFWQTNLLTGFGGNVISYQNCASPLLEGGLIFLNANAGTARLMALRTSDGSLAWRSENEAMTHSTPVLATIHGVRQVIFATQSGLVSVDPSTGTRLWRFTYPFTYSGSIGVSPVVYQDLIYHCGAQAYGMGSFVVRVSVTNDVWTTAQLWRNTGYASTLASHWMTPIAYQGFLYGQFGVQSSDSPSAQLKCVDMLTGAVKWSADGFGRAATLLVDGQVVAVTERGSLVLARADTNSYVELGRFLAIPNYFADTNKCWNAPAVCDGRVYVRSTAFVAAFDLSVPPLKLDPPEPTSASALRLTIRTVTGAPLASNRVAGMEVRASDDPALDLSQWLPLPNSLSLTDGVVRIENVDSTATPRKYYILREPQ
jgi:outer membrane protein assembly factor BamB